MVTLCAICVLLLSTFAFSSSGEISDIDGFDVTWSTSDDNNSYEVSYANGVLSMHSEAYIKGQQCQGSANWVGIKIKLLFTNNSSSSRGISFDYSVSGDGLCEINGHETRGQSSYIGVVESGSSLTIIIKSNDLANSTESIILTNIESIEYNSTSTYTFTPSDGGTITVNGQIVNSQFFTIADFADGVTISATPANGFKFLYWVDSNNRILSVNSSEILRSTSPSVNVHALFVSQTNTPNIFCVDDTVYFDFDQAVQASLTSKNHTVIVSTSTTFSSRTYVIPNGVTLVIPCNSDQFLYTDNPVVLFNKTDYTDGEIYSIYGTHTTPSAYVKLTLSDGAHLVIEQGGAISVTSKLSAVGQGTGSWNGTPTGTHGRIDLSAGTEITLNNGAALYCFGYIAGEGTVNALPGSTVWEAFQIRSWRGGSASFAMVKMPTFILSQYYVQNIESDLILSAGATEHVFTAISVQGAAYTANAVFIGQGGLFNLTNGFVKKSYDGISDRTIVDIEGDLSLSDLTLTGLPYVGSLSTATTESLPINGNITINVNSGNTLIGVNLAFLPGCIINVSESATLEISEGKNVFIYDLDNWGQYAGAGLAMVPIGYSTVNGTNTIRTTASLTDVVFDINGTLTVNGHLYTTGTEEETSVGADIISNSESGNIVFANSDPASVEYTYQVTQSGIDVTLVQIPVTSAKLHNADGTYTLTTGAAGGDTYVYCPYCDVWGLDEDHAHTGTVIWENWDETELMREDVAYGVVPEYTGTTPEKVSNDPRFNYVFHDWYQTRTEVSGEVTKYTAEFKAFSTDPAQTNNALKFTTAALTLENDITVNFKINKNAVDNAGFNLLYTIFTVNNEAKIVTGYEKDGYYVFDCKGVFPKYLNNRIFATLYAEKDGTLYTATTSYRAATYCYSLFNNPGTEAPELLKKLAVDTLLYGEAAQLHFNYRTDALCTSKLTAEHMAYASTSTGELVNRLSIEKTIETASASWKAATLFLNNSIDFRFQFSHTNGTEGLYAIMTDTVTGRTWRVSSFESAKDSNTGNVIADNYWVFFKGLNASQMNNEVEVVIYNADDEQISRTLHYSIESYVKYTVENSTNEKLLNLVECIIKYGNSAKAYVNRNN